MTLEEIMAKTVIRIHPEEPVEAAARLLARYNIGALPVCRENGELCGMLTDRDIVTRCVAAGRPLGTTKVGELMTTRLVCAKPDMEPARAADLMGKEQIRRLPVVEDGRLCGMVSLGDLAGCPAESEAALRSISSNLSSR